MINWVKNTHTCIRYNRVTSWRSLIQRGSLPHQLKIELKSLNQISGQISPLEGCSDGMPIPGTAQDVALGDRVWWWAEPVAGLGFRALLQPFLNCTPKKTKCRRKSQVRMLRKLLEEMDETRKWGERNLFLTLCDPKNICCSKIQGLGLDTGIPNLFPT